MAGVRSRKPPAEVYSGCSLSIRRVAASQLMLTGIVNGQNRRSIYTLQDAPIRLSPTAIVSMDSHDLSGIPALCQFGRTVRATVRRHIDGTMYATDVTLDGDDRPLAIVCTGSGRILETLYDDECAAAGHVFLQLESLAKNSKNIADVIVPAHAVWPPLEKYKSVWSFAPPGSQVEVKCLLPVGVPGFYKKYEYLQIPPQGLKEKDVINAFNKVADAASIEVIAVTVLSKPSVVSGCGVFQHDDVAHDIYITSPLHGRVEAQLPLVELQIDTANIKIGAAVEYTAALKKQADGGCTYLATDLCISETETPQTDPSPPAPNTKPLPTPPCKKPVQKSGTVKSEGLAPLGTNIWDSGIFTPSSSCQASPTSTEQPWEEAREFVRFAFGRLSPRDVRYCRMQFPDFFNKVYDLDRVF